MGNHQIPEQIEAAKASGKSVYFRFFDPGTLNTYLPTCTDGEVQFHTPSSFAAKQETHPLYEVWRTLDKKDPLRDALNAQQNEIFSQVPIPGGATGIR